MSTTQDVIKAAREFVKAWENNVLHTREARHLAKVLSEYSEPKLPAETKPHEKAPASKPAEPPPAKDKE